MSDLDKYPPPRNFIILSIRYMVLRAHPPNGLPDDNNDDDESIIKVPLVALLSRCDFYCPLSLPTRTALERVVLRSARTKSKSVTK